MERTVSDISLYFKMTKCKISSIAGNVTTTTSTQAERGFKRRRIELIITTFESKSLMYDNFTFLVNIITKKKPNLHMLN